MSRKHICYLASIVSVVELNKRRYLAYLGLSADHVGKSLDFNGAMTSPIYTVSTWPQLEQIDYPILIKPQHIHTCLAEHHNLHPNNLAAMLLKLIHVAQIVIAAYGAMQSQAAISKLLEYEDATKKLAKISSEAERQLHKTRTTQASGAIAILVSFVVSVLLTTGGASYGFLVRYLVSPGMALAIFAAQTHLQDFWAGKGGKVVTANKIPLPKMGAYNDALERTQRSLEVLGWLTISWVASSALALIEGY